MHWYVGITCPMLFDATDFRQMSKNNYWLRYLWLDVVAENNGLVKSSSYLFSENKSNKGLGKLKFHYHNNEKSTIKWPPFSRLPDVHSLGENRDSANALRADQDTAKVCRTEPLRKVRHYDPRNLTVIFVNATGQCTTRSSNEISFLITIIFVIASKDNMTRTLSQCSVVAVLPSLSKVCSKVSETDSWLLWRDTELSVSDQLNKATWTGERSFNHFKSHPSFHSTLSALSLWKPPFHPPISYLGHVGNWCKMLNWLKNRTRLDSLTRSLQKLEFPLGAT